MQTITERLASVQERIAVACQAAGRKVTEVRLLPVSKFHGARDVRTLAGLGCRSFGESQVQELASKAAALEDLDLTWVFLGHLQTNKAGLLARTAHEFQALDSERAAAALQRGLEASDRTMDVLLEVNSSGEASKFGLAPDEVPRLAEALVRYPRLRPRGLMTLAANTPDERIVAASFQTMVALRDRLRAESPGEWHELSMGMSGDLELAIAHGATCVRVGTAIFGPREN